jgi:hypothetical protein
MESSPGRVKRTLRAGIVDGLVAVALVIVLIGVVSVALRSYARTSNTGSETPSGEKTVEVAVVRKKLLGHYPSCRPTEDRFLVEVTSEWGTRSVVAEGDRGTKISDGEKLRLRVRLDKEGAPLAYNPCPGLTIAQLRDPEKKASAMRADLL